MAISRLGNLVAGAAKNGGNVTLTFSSAPAQGDIVYVFGGHHTAGTGSYGPQASFGYTEVKTPDIAGLFGFGVWRKVMGASPDSNVVCQGNGAGADVTVYACAIYTGGSGTTPEDVAIPAFATGTSTNPDAPTIDPVTNDCAIIIAAISTTADTTPGTPSGYATPVGGTASDTSGALQIYISDRILSGSAAEDPPAFGTWSSGTWKAITVAVRPQPATQGVTPSAYDDVTATETFFVPALAPGAVDIAPTLFASDDAFFAPTVEQPAGVQDLTPSLFSDPDTIYDPVLTTTAGPPLPAYAAGGGIIRKRHLLYQAEFRAPTVVAALAQNIDPSLYTDGDSFYAPTVAATYSLQPSHYDDVDAFFAPTIAATYDIQPLLYEDADAFFAPTIAATYDIQPGLFDSDDAFYVPTVQLASGPQDVTPSLFVDADSFYVPTIAGPQATVGTSYAGAGGFWTKRWRRPAVSVTVVIRTAISNNIFPSLFTDTDTFNAPTITTGSVDVSPSLFNDDDAFFAPVVSLGTELQPSLYTDADSFFAPSIGVGSVDIAPSLYTEADNFFAPSVTAGAVDIAPSLYTDADAFFAPVIAAVVSPALHDDTDTFYVPSISVGPVDVAPSLFTDADAFYAPVVSGGLTLQDVQPELVIDTDLFFAPFIVNAGALVQPPGRWTAVALETRARSSSAESRSTSGVAEDRSVDTTSAEDRSA